MRSFGFFDVQKERTRQRALISVEAPNLALSPFDAGQRV
jgi:hypothetical protein